MSATAVEDRQRIEGPSAESAPAGLRVLVVDDHRDCADSLAMLLRHFGHEVRIVDNGPAALASAWEDWPDVVLLDINLPDMDGWEVARRIGRPPAKKRPLLIAVTGFGHDMDYLRSKEAGIDLHLVKPVDPAYLQGLLRRFHTVIH